MRIQLRPNLDQDLCLITGAKQVVDWRQIVIETDVYNAAANRQDRTVTLALC